MISTSLKVSKKKFMELIEKSHMVYLTTDTNLLNNIIYLFTCDYHTYYLSIDNNNNAIIIHNQEDKPINMDFYHMIRKQAYKASKEIINLDYHSSTFREIELMDYWYCAKEVATSTIEPILLTFVNDNKELLTQEQHIKIKKWLINHINLIPFKLSQLVDYINTFGNLINKESKSMVNGETMALFTWIEKEKEQEKIN